MPRLNDALEQSFNTQPPEGGWLKSLLEQKRFEVSTHSRPKAAGLVKLLGVTPSGCFNTQPPEGGWVAESIYKQFGMVSTHSRPKAAGYFINIFERAKRVSTHSRPKAAGLLNKL